MTSLTIRTRVALSYGLVIVVVLLVMALVVSLVHQRIGFARVDAELADAMRALDGVVVAELGEHEALPEASIGALHELQLPGVGVAILDGRGAILATQASGLPMPSPAQLQRQLPGAQPQTLADHNIRVGASAWQHGADSYRIVAWMSLAPFDREHATLQNTIRVGIPIAALVAMIAGWLIGRWALRPLTAMAADAGAIDHRSLEGRLPVTAQRDELGRLGAAFNAVLDRLAVVLRTQRRFMADASHELRTPVSVARTAAQVTLSTTTRTEAEYRDSLDVIATQMRRLTRVVDDMFMLALADLDARPLEPRDLYLDEIVGDCVRAATVLASARNIHIDYGHTGEIAARGDEALLRQLVMNLLDNAVRHTPSAGTVTVNLQRHDGHAELAVEDSGPGVPAAEQGRVFERFVRLAPSGTGGGAGLGLAIARWVAEQHGGRLSLDGDGAASSRFVLTLPV